MNLYIPNKNNNTVSFLFRLLRELNVIKNNVRISFNNDSSVEVSRENISGSEKIEDKQLRRRISGSISTPKFINKAYGPFDCTLSPISAWRLTNANPKDPWNSTCQLKSTILDRGNINLIIKLEF